MNPVDHFSGILLIAILVAATPALKEVSSAKLDCYPIDGATKESCEALGCVWAPVDDAQQNGRASNTKKSRVDEPWCYQPENYLGYKVVHSSAQEHRIRLQRARPSALGAQQDVQEVMVEVEPHDEFVRVKISDPNQARFEPPIPVMNLAEAAKKRKEQLSADELTTATETSKIKIELNQRESGRLSIIRANSGATLFSTDLRRLIFSDKFIQLNTQLDSPFLYGLGEHFDTFLKRADDKYKVYSFYNTDAYPQADGQRSYGTFPFFINLDSNETQAHGVYLRNSNGMDIVVQPDMSVTFRPIGGILDFYLFLGPSAHDVISQYQHAIGLPDMPPRWSLGFQLCRYNYGSLEKTKLVWRRIREAGIPFDVQWNDLDAMANANDFTYDKDKFRGLPEFVDELHKNNMHYMYLFDAGVSRESNYYPYKLGEEMGIFIRNATNQTLVGRVWNLSGQTVWPDFSNVKSIDYWTELFIKFQQEVAYDGAWIDMNDVSNFADGSLDGCPYENQLERPPYRPGGTDLQKHSLCLTAQHTAGSEYNVHNLYSFFETIATQKALSVARLGKRSLIISRSTSVGQGHYGGHWSGDLPSTWEYMRWSIPSLIEHSMYGFSSMGSDICGFIGNTTPQLCARWSTLGAFYTFSRNHNDDKSIDQDPVALGPEVVEANKNAYKKKYSLVPYLYTLLYRAHKFGEPAIRSVPLEFHATDKKALEVEDQFMWGHGLMISPIVHENTYVKQTYLPRGRWYETDVSAYNGTPKIPKVINSTGEWVETKNVALSNIPIFYRGGTIIPIYPAAGQTIPDTVKQPIGLEVALCAGNMAHGQLFLDDGETDDDDKHSWLSLEAANGQLDVTMTKDDYTKGVQFGQVQVFGILTKVNSVKVNNEKTIPFEQHDHMLSLDLGGLHMVSIGKPLRIQWT